MERSITSNSVGKLCRVCLTTSKNVNPLTSSIESKAERTILDMLEIVTFSKVVNDKKLPSKICQMCVSFLKMAHDFQEQFKNSQELLKKAINIDTVQAKQVQHNVKLVDASVGTMESLPVAVELIYGNNRFDLNNVLVIEDDETEDFSYDGFLNNLGTEVSARFRNGQFPDSVQQNEKDHPLPALQEYEINLTPLRPKRRGKLDSVNENHLTRSRTETHPELDYDNLDLSRLKVKRYPDECKIVIEEETTHLPVKILYECPTCKKVLPSYNTFKLHKDVYHPFHQPLVCDQCGLFVRTRSQLYHHMQKHKGKRFQCDHCDKKYDTISRLKIHLEAHKNERRFLCNICGKNFNYAISLTYHLKLHSEKQLVCNVCGLKYRMPNTLKRHMRTHTKERPYSCNYCCKRFPSRSEQHRHEMLHTGIRPHSCEYCGKGFIKLDYLKTHYLSHPGPRQCNLCHKSFLEMEFLKLHTKRAHKDYECEMKVEIEQIELKEEAEN